MLENTEILERTKDVAMYIIQHNATVRQAAEEFGISKSTVHEDVTKRLKKLDRELYYKVRKVLNYNFSQRGIRGGSATRKRYKNTSKK